MMMGIWQHVRGYVAGVVALVACPCHIPLTLPIVLSLTAGTAVGVFLERYSGWVYAFSAALFVGGLILAAYWMGSNNSKEGASCPPKQARLGQTQLTPRGEKRTSGDGLYQHSAWRACCWRWC